MLQKSILKRTEFSDLPSTPEMTESESKIGPFVRTRDRSIRLYNASFCTRLLGPPAKGVPLPWTPRCVKDTSESLTKTNNLIAKSVPDLSMTCRWLADDLSMTRRCLDDNLPMNCRWPADFVSMTESWDRLGQVCRWEIWSDLIDNHCKHVAWKKMNVKLQIWKAFLSSRAVRSSR